MCKGKHSEQCLKKISESRRGIPSHRKGRTLEEEYGPERAISIRRKSSTSHVGLQSGEKHPMWGRRHSDESIKKIVLNRRGKGLGGHSGSFRKGMIPWNKGQKNHAASLWMRENNPMKNPETRMRAAQFLRSVPRETRSKNSKENWLNPTYRTKQIASRLGKHYSPKTEFKKGRKESPEIFAKRLKALHEKPNKMESKLLQIIENASLPYRYVGDGRPDVNIEGLSPDFINSNGEKKIIEFFGKPWHSINSPFSVGPKSIENVRKEIFARNGYQTLVIWDEELNNIESLVSKIKVFDQNKSVIGCRRSRSRAVLRIAAPF